MRSSLTRTVFAILSAASMWSWVAASDVGFSGIGRAFSDASRHASGQNVQQVAYFSEAELGGECMQGHGPPAYGCGDGCYGGCGDCCSPDYYCQPATGMCYAETQIMFLRAHVSENAVGKLSEKYDISARTVVGYENCAGIGVRGRYWVYNHTTSNLDITDADLGLDFQVYDIEGTGRFRTERADLVISAGFRWVDAEIEVFDETVRAGMPGFTAAMDGRAWLCRSCNSQWSAVAGVRWSILGTDWEGEDNFFMDRIRDDNLVVQEMYGGFEYLHRLGMCDIYARLVFEIQNWHSDAIAQSSGTDSIGFLGPGFHVGAMF